MRAGSILVKVPRFDAEPVTYSAIPVLDAPELVQLSHFETLFARLPFKESNVRLSSFQS